MQQQELRGKVGIVTGAASGIGLALSRALAKEGMRLCITDMSAQTLKTEADKLRSCGYDILDLTLNVTDRNQWARVAAEMEMRFGSRVHLLCNNAGVMLPHAPALDIASFADWEWVLSVNLMGTINGVNTFVPRMKHNDGMAHILNTASITGLLPVPGQGVYCTSKRAVVAFSEVLALDLAAYKISVSVLCPGIVASNIGRSASYRSDTSEALSKEVIDTAAANVAFKNRQGISADSVAQKAIEGIRAKQFYICTHPEYLPALQNQWNRLATEYPRSAVPKEIDDLKILASKPPSARRESKL